MSVWLWPPIHWLLTCSNLDCISLLPLFRFLISIHVLLVQEAVVWIFYYLHSIHAGSHNYYDLLSALLVPSMEILSGFSLLYISVNLNLGLVVNEHQTVFPNSFLVWKKWLTKCTHETLVGIMPISSACTPILSLTLQSSIYITQLSQYGTLYIFAQVHVSIC